MIYAKGRTLKLYDCQKKISAPSFNLGYPITTMAQMYCLKKILNFNLGCPITKITQIYY